MALLHRFLRLNDSKETAIFTFIVTKSVTRDLHRDVTSKEFCYGHHRWAITFSRIDNMLGIFLIWRNPSDSMRVFVDFTFTLLNTDHFSQNESFSRKNVKFTKDTPAQGSRKFVTLTTLEEGNFMDRNGEFQLELKMAGVASTFEHKFKINQSIFNNSKQFGKLETSYFSYSPYDWNLSLYPTGRSDSQLGTSESIVGSPTGNASMTIYLNRQTGLDRNCRVKFNLKIGDGESRVESGDRDEISDHDGKSYGWLPMVKFADCVSRGVLKLIVEMISINTVSLLEIPVVPPNPVGLPVYDKDKLAWEVEPDMNGDTLKLRMIHKDAKNIPRNHIRYVCWSAYLIKNHPKLKHALGGGSKPKDYTAKIPLDQKLYFQYFVQDDTEDGTLMDTKIPIKEITDSSLGYLIGRSNIRIQIEWIQSYLLFQSTYHHYDDLIRVQTYQMRHDIANLRLENDMLEQRLCLYENKKSSCSGRNTDKALINLSRSQEDLDENEYA
ncbi:uncharacterized protein [Lepeophtheirus salmonis]|uniref:uncharacterized protein n=1 Tax=Lepeophtheirus salmonis TaxID=72036 RepID=UPI001AE2BBFC|nr:uncharacterized protein LOC121118572 [Lepeophtheirus salmonis]